MFKLKPAVQLQNKYMKNLQNKLVPVLTVVLIVCAFFIGSLYSKVQMLEKNGAPQVPSGQVAGAGNQPQAPEPTPGPVTFDIGTEPILGNASAKVMLVEFTDYQCPFCRSLVDGAIKQVKTDYIDTGKAKLIVMNFPLSFHENAQKSAEAAECAKEQNKFWEMHDKLFANNDKLTVDDLKKYAADLGLNTGNFNSCLDSGKTANKIKADAALGQKVGVQGTPATFVGTVKGTSFTGTVVSGAQPFANFKTAIDLALK